MAGAIYSGFAMVLVLAIPLRKVYGLEGLITQRHLDNSAKIMLATGMIVAYAYITGSASRPGTAATSTRQSAIWHRMTGPYATQYWLLVFCNIVVPAGAVVQARAHEAAAAVHRIA